jgi:PIN domain nuclease of toxin-antitoxin system
LGRAVTERPYLFDTNALLWAMADPKRLSKAALKALHKGPRVVSVVAFWEIVIKAQKGQLQIADPVLFWNQAIGHLKASILSIRADHIAALAHLPKMHKDPFDRMLVAQAVVEEMMLVSSDEHLNAYPIRVVW